MIKNKLINKMKIGLVGAALFLSLVAGASVALAANLTYGSNTTVVVNGRKYIILSGSGATSVVLNPTTLVVVLPSSTTFTLVSANRDTLASGGAGVATCTNTQSQRVLSIPGTITITPTSTACGPMTGGGGGGGASADVTPPTSTSISISVGAATTASTAVNLTLGATGASQMMISNNSAFTAGVWETYAIAKAWTLTIGNGVKPVFVKFRDAAGNISIAVSDTITLNTTTPIVAAPVVPVVAGTVPGVTVINLTAVQGITANLFFGSRRPEVKILQQFLADQDKGVNARALKGHSRTMYFGKLTEAALREWQVSKGVSPAVGYFGPITRAMIKSLQQMSSI